MFQGEALPQTACIETSRKACRTGAESNRPVPIRRESRSSKVWCAFTGYCEPSALPDRWYYKSLAKSAHPLLQVFPLLSAKDKGPLETSESRLVERNFGSRDRLELLRRRAETAIAGVAMDGSIGLSLLVIDRAEACTFPRQVLRVLISTVFNRTRRDCRRISNSATHSQPQESSSMTSLS